jgi:hypothetical protein
LLARRLTRRGFFPTSGSLAAGLSAESASASAPPALVASTIKAASLLAAGQAAGVVSATVAALTQGVVKAMFVTKIKSVLATALVVAALVGATGLIYQTQAAEQPNGSHKVVRAWKSAEKESPVSASPADEISSKTVQKDPKVLTPEEAIRQRPTGEVTVQFRVAAVEVMPNKYYNYSGYSVVNYYLLLKDGGRLTARLAMTADRSKELGPDPVKHFNGKVVRVTGQVVPDAGNPSFMMWVVDLTHIEVVKE